MGNKNSSAPVSNDNGKNLINLNLIIKEYLKSDKLTNDFLTNNKKAFHKKKYIKSNLRENLESTHIVDYSLDLASVLINTSINHETNNTLYKSLTIHKLAELNLDSEFLNSQNNMLINWMYKTLLSGKAGKYDNFIPQIKENNWLDKLNHVSSIHAQSDINISSYQLSDNNLSLYNEKNKKKKLKLEKMNSDKDKKIGRTHSSGVLNKEILNLNPKSKKAQFSSPSNKNLVIY